LFSLLGMIVYPMRWLYRASDVGLYRVDRDIQSGIDYSRGLRLAKNSLDFLGTGASKLTSNPEFEQAIERCHRPNRPIRFLLSAPDNPALRKAEAQAKTTPGAYGHLVAQSLKELARLKLEREMNIVVKLYKNSHEEPSQETFRLMFVDDAICLMSYNFYGRGEGRDLPQLMFRNTHDADDTKVFYSCFVAYFERVWNSAEEWNPESYV
jgi:hypothetical protein